MHAITWMFIMAFTVSINAVGLLANDAPKQEVVFDDSQEENTEVKKAEKKKEVVNADEEETEASAAQ